MNMEEEIACSYQHKCMLMKGKKEKLFKKDITVFHFMKI